jgi:hypothetical protein
LQRIHRDVVRNIPCEITGVLTVEILPVMSQNVLRGAKRPVMQSCHLTDVFWSVSR